MWRFRLIRFRLTLTYTLLLAAAFALFSGAIVIGLNNVLYNNFEQSVQQAATKVVKQFKITSVPVGYPDIGVHVNVTAETASGDVNTSKDYQYAFLGANGQPLFDPNGHPVTSSKPADPKVTTNPKTKQAITQALVSQSPQSLTLEGSNGDNGVVVVPIEDQAVLVLQASEQDTEDTVSLLQRTIIMAAAVMTLLSGAGAWFLTGRILRPIDDMSKRVRKITIHDLNERLRIRQHDEIGRLASTFNDMIARLQASFDRQKRFTSDASHELRTPLTVMQADIDLALRRPRSVEEYRETLQSAQEEVTRLSHIVSDLLTLTRLDTDVAFVEHEPVALDDLIDSIVTGMQPLAKDRGILLTHMLEGPATILGDITRLKQLFINLLDNALNYTPLGGHIYVAVETTLDEIRVSISDSGIGIEPEHLPHVFERFYRADQARSRNHEGTGLGLAIAQSSAQAHHGRIEVSSVIGAGSVFTVILPSSGVFAQQAPEMTKQSWFALPALN